MADYADREQNFNASLGHVMGGWMADVAKADILRQKAWLAEVQALATPDKDGAIPQITLASGIKGKDGKPLSEADITFPVVLALLGEQFAAAEADLSMTMNVSASSLDETKGEQAGSASGEGGGSILGFHVSVKVSASFSESEDHKRESDYRATTSASVKMTRVPTPEPIQRVLEAFMSVVDVECQLAKAQITQNATQRAREQGLLPKTDEGGGDAPAPPAPADNGGDNG